MQLKREMKGNLLVISALVAFKDSRVKVVNSFWHHMLIFDLIVGASSVLFTNM